MVSQRALEIERRVKENGESLADIARDLGISRQRVSIVLKEAGIELGLKGGNIKGQPMIMPRCDGTTYKLAKSTVRMKIPKSVDDALVDRFPSSGERTAWLRKVITEAAIKEFGITIE